MSTLVDNIVPASGCTYTMAPMSQIATAIPKSAGLVEVQDDLKVH